MIILTSYNKVCSILFFPYQISFDNEKIFLFKKKKKIILQKQKRKVSHIYLLYTNTIMILILSY